MKLSPIGELTSLCMISKVKSKKAGNQVVLCSHGLKTDSPNPWDEDRGGQGDPDNTGVSSSEIDPVTCHNGYDDPKAESGNGKIRTPGTSG